MIRARKILYNLIEALVKSGRVQPGGRNAFSKFDVDVFYTFSIVFKNRVEQGRDTKDEDICVV